MIRNHWNSNENYHRHNNLQWDQCLQEDKPLQPSRTWSFRWKSTPNSWPTTPTRLPKNPKPWRKKPRMPSPKTTKNSPRCTSKHPPLRMLRPWTLGDLGWRWTSSLTIWKLSKTTKRWWVPSKGWPNLWAKLTIPICRPSPRILAASKNA